MYIDKRDPLTEGEERRIIDACRTPLEKLLVILPLDTGMRAIEIENLDKKDFIWQHRKIAVQGEPKRDDRHIIQLSNRAYDLLSSWFTFKDTIGVKKRDIQYHVTKVAKRAGLSNVNFHTLRRTFAVRGIKENMSLRELMVNLGFNSEEMLKAFLNVSIDEIRQSMLKSSVDAQRVQSGITEGESS